MDYTTNYNLKKPNGAADGDFVKVEDLNSNFDAIDTELKENADDINAHTADTTIHITATERTNFITNFASSVRATVLTGLSTATNAAIAAADTVLSALGKLQKQITDHKTDVSNPHTVTKTQVGLGNCDNTSDANKPISTATATAMINQNRRIRMGGI